MVKPDVDLISVIPRQARYKFFERMVNRNRHLFNDVIIVVTDDEVTGEDHLGDMIAAVPDATYLDIPKTKGDWRNIATNHALKYSDTRMVWFMEPDFFMPKLELVLLLYSWKDIAVGIDVDGRLHPACLYLPRIILDKTSLDFSADPPKYDHFDKVTEQLKTFGNIKYLNEDDYVHMAGLTHNMRLEAQGKEIAYKPNQYKLYKTLSHYV